MEFAGLAAIGNPADVVNRAVVPRLQFVGIFDDLVDEVTEVEHETELCIAKHAWAVAQAGGRRALILNILSGTSGIAGALVAYVTVGFLPGVRPVILALSSASLLYIAMSDLIPGLHRGQIDRNGLRQVVLIVAGVLTVAVFGRLIGG